MGRPLVWCVRVGVPWCWGAWGVVVGSGGSRRGLWRKCGLAVGVGVANWEGVGNHWDAADKDGDAVRWVPALLWACRDVAPAVAGSWCNLPRVRRWAFFLEFDRCGHPNARVGKVDSWAACHVAHYVTVVQFGDYGLAPGAKPVCKRGGAG